MVTKNTRGGGRNGHRRVGGIGGLERDNDSSEAVNSPAPQSIEQRRSIRSSHRFQPYNVEISQGRTTPQHPIDCTAVRRSSTNAGSPTQQSIARAVPSSSAIRLGPLRSTSTILSTTVTPSQLPGVPLALGIASPSNLSHLPTAALHPLSPHLSNVASSSFPVPSAATQNLHQYLPYHPSQQPTPSSSSGLINRAHTNSIDNRYMDDEERRENVDPDEQNFDDEYLGEQDDDMEDHATSDSPMQEQSRSASNQTIGSRPLTIVERNIQRDELDIRNTSDPDLIQYTDKIKYHVYLQDAFPDVTQGHELSMRFSREIEGIVPTDQRRFTIPTDIRKMVRSKASSFRISAHSGMKDVLLVYEFDSRSLPRSSKTRGKSQYRFAREGFVATGALLQNRSIGECLYHLMYNTNGGASRLSPPPDRITREFIALAYVMMFYRMVLMYNLQYICPEWRDQFRDGSHWYDIYRRTIQGYGSDTEEVIDWDTVLEFQNNVIREMMNRNGRHQSTSNPEAFFVAMYPDGFDIEDD
ncbi:hypothetical protein BJV82DRAFT_676293 [Fennellomyces sp. T-0311]|nr:hypothetical protein BJV82DRAFT_676293 [Fennellomyces sp. T-0311]